MVSLKANLMVMKTPSALADLTLQLKDYLLVVHLVLEVELSLVMRLENAKLLQWELDLSLVPLLAMCTHLKMARNAVVVAQQRQRLHYIVS